MVTKKLERQLYAIKDKNIGFSCTDGFFGYEYMKNKKYPLYNSEHHFKKLKKSIGGQDILKVVHFKVWDYNFLKHHNSVVLSSVIVEKNLIQQLGGFRGLYRTLILNTLLIMIVG